MFEIASQVRPQVPEAKRVTPKTGVVFQLLPPMACPTEAAAVQVEKSVEVRYWTRPLWSALLQKAYAVEPSRVAWIWYTSTVSVVSWVAADQVAPLSVEVLT